MATSENEGSQASRPSAPRLTISPQVRAVLQRAALSLESAIATVETDPHACLDDLLAAQLLIHTLLATSATRTPSDPPTTT